MPAKAVRVAICVCTCNRPEALKELLGGISRLTFRRVQRPNIEIIVVDNGGPAKAKEVCRAASVSHPLKYVVEAQRGISFARNRAISEANAADFIAFIDDDEIPAPEWLDELLLSQREFAADVVTGPVLPRYAPGTPEWVKSGGFFNNPVLPTGSIREISATNNVLIGTHVFAVVPSFNPAFALSGAEDTHFFLQARQVGCKIVWSQEAAVFETVNRERANAKWLLRREFQTGNGWVFCEASLANGWSLRSRRLIKALGHVSIGSGKALAACLFWNRVDFVRSLQRISLGLGMCVGVAGHRFLAYRNAGSVAIGPGNKMSPSTTSATS